MSAAERTNALPISAAADIPRLVEGLALARSNQDQRRIAVQGLQRVLHARVSVSTRGAFRPELRQLIESAVLVPSSHHPAPVTALGAPRVWPASTQTLLISGWPHHQMPRYLLWRPRPFDANEIRAADAIALMMVALHLSWLAKEDVNGRAVVSHQAGERNDLRLTEREIFILEHLARGLSADAIARVADISTRTVRKHLQHIYAKLGAHDRLVAVESARAAGLLRGGGNELVSR